MRTPEYRSTHSALILAATLLISTVFVAACDTVARVSFQNRNLRAVHSSGFISPSGEDGSQCGSLGTDRQAKAKLQFVLLDDQGTTRPYVSKTAANIELDSESLSNGRVFEPEDVTCEPGQGGQQSPDCDVSGYTCSGDSPESRRCSRSTNFQFGDFRMLRDTKDDRDNALGILVEHGASTGGALPPNIGGDWYDSDGDGEGDTEVRSVVRERSTDDQLEGGGLRINALFRFVDSWENVAKVSQERRNATTYFGLWALTDRDNAVSAVSTENGAGGTQTPYWSSVTGEDGQVQDGDADQFVDELTNGGISQTDNVVQPLVAATDLINGPFKGENNDAYTNADKSLFLIVDGPPELPLSSTTNLDLPGDLIEDANDNGVRIHIVHFDPRFDDLSLFPDSQPYWEEQLGSTCGSDDDCQDWEVCRDVKGFADRQGGDVSPEPMGSYCMPERRQEDGRYGPISVYAQVACATGGSYQYVKSNRSIAKAIEWLPYETDAMWEADVEIGRVNDGEVEFGGPSRIQATFDATVNGRTETVTFSQDGYSFDQDVPEGATDNRSTIFIDEQN